MKPNTIVLKTVVVSMLVVNQLAPSVSAVAQTSIESTVQTSATTTSNEKTENIEDTETKNTDEETSQTEKTAIPKVMNVETDYEEQTLKDKKDELSIHPVLQWEVKQLTESFHIKGKLLADTEEQSSVTSETLLKKLVLQSKTSNTKWQDEKEFMVSKDTIISQTPHEFEYDAEIDTGKKYRLIVDYDIQWETEKELHSIEYHKAHYMIGDTQKEDEIKNSEQEVSQQESTTRIEDTQTSDAFNEQMMEASSMFEKENKTQKSTDSSVEDTRATEETEGAQIKTQQLFSDDQQLQTIQNTNQIPNLLREARAALTRSTTYPGLTDSKYSCVIQYNQTEAAIDSIHTYNASTQQYFVFSTNKDLYKNVMGTTSYLTAEQKVNFFNQASHVYECPSNVSNISLGDSQYRSRCLGVNGLNPNTTYYVWQIGHTATNDRYISSAMSATASTETYNGVTVFKPWSFRTETMPNLNISTPTVNQSSASDDGTTVTINSGSFTGVPSNNSSDGVVQYSSNDWSSTSTKSGLTHSTGGTSGTYNAFTLTGLTPGTRYRAKIGLYSLGSTNYGYSASSGYFYTANQGSGAPIVTSNTAAPDSNNGTASVSANYTVGSEAAHPSEAKILIRENGGSWSTLGSSTTPKVDSVSIDTGTKKVTYNLSKLKTKTNYQVACSFKNASTVWSRNSDTSVSFQAKGVALSVSRPNFVDDSTTSQAQLKLNSGSYSGDIHATGTATDGIIRVSDNDGISYTDKMTNLQYGGNTYNAATFSSGIEFGRRYKGYVFLRDSNNNNIQSEISGYAYTVNKVNSPSNVIYNTPTITSPVATASMYGSYVVSSVSSEAAHPKDSGVTDGYDGQKGVEIQLKSSNDPNYASWKSVKNLATSDSPAFINQLSINQVNNRIEFSLTGLEARTTYYLRYRVKNAGNKWSEYSSDSYTITTKGVQLVPNSPTFYQSTATATSIELNGYYSGDISQTLKGDVCFESTSSNWQQLQSVVDHEYIRGNGSTIGTFSGEVNGLKPGTRYRGWTRLYDYENQATTWKEQIQEDGSTKYFYTKNTIDNLTTPTLNQPIDTHDATATFTTHYQAGDDSDSSFIAAHPNQVKVLISQDGINFTEVNTTNSINFSTKTVTFTIEQLRAGVTYSVKYQVVNDGGSSDYSATKTFTTNNRATGLYINSVPTFNFKSPSVSNEATIVGVNGTQDLAVDIENVGVNNTWALSASLSELSATNGSTLTGTSLIVGKQLNRTIDETTWVPINSEFDGISDSSVNLPADGTSVTLFKPQIISAGIGSFRNMIRGDSVKLTIPGNTGEQGTVYQGRLTWNLDVLP